MPRYLILLFCIISFSEAAEFTLNLQNIEDRYYVAKINIGEPPQSFNCILTTQSHLTWVVGKDSELDIPSKFSCVDSNTCYREATSIQYQYTSEDRLIGDLATDSLTIEGLDSEGLPKTICIEKYRFLIGYSFAGIV